MPNASAPNAPCVEVCESPHTIVIPGCVSPSSGPITCTIPSRPLPVAFSGTPNSAQFARERVELRLRDRVADRPRLGRDVVIHRRDRQVGPAHRPAGEPQPLERLRARHLVHEVEVDVEQRRLAGPLVDDVRVPDPLEERRAPSVVARRGVAAEDPHLARPLAHLDERRLQLARRADGRRAPCRSGSGRSSCGIGRDTSCTRFRPWRWNGPSAW